MSLTARLYRLKARAAEQRRQAALAKRCAEGAFDPVTADCLRAAARGFVERADQAAREARKISLFTE